VQRKADSQIDFDDWSELAARDPDAFERRRAAVLEEFIQQAPENRQQRLRRLQWRIDRTRELAPTPLAACVKISQMMWDSLLGDSGLLEALEQLQAPKRAPKQPPRSAAVLDFKRLH
jgi:hypothetical protein